MLHQIDEKSLKVRFRRAFALADGCEPDPRFTLANERTFLAWIRTAIALLASGIALDALPLDLFAGRLQMLLSYTLTGMALLVSVNAPYAGSMWSAPYVAANLFRTQSWHQYWVYSA
ncbi:DUF202 domain-containing protein [Pseudomonas gessardii]|nr:DUF202 domain-containing protein [Pseudomonas gessardii]